MQIFKIDHLEHLKVAIFGDWSPFYHVHSCIILFCSQKYYPCDLKYYYLCLYLLEYNPDTIVVVVLL